MADSRTYKTAIYRGISNVDLVDLPCPECGGDEIIIRNLLTGVCGSAAPQGVSAPVRAGADTTQAQKVSVSF